MGGYGLNAGEEFVWRVGRGEVKLSWGEEVWVVTYTSVGRLLGPRIPLYEGRHREATYAAWDVMARVVHASRDEEEGVRAGRSAAQWLKSRVEPPPPSPSQQ